MYIYGIKHHSGNRLKISYRLDHNVESNYETEYDDYDLVEISESGPIWLTDDIEVAKKKLRELDCRINSRGKEVFMGDYKIFRIGFDEEELESVLN